jgi:murein DD-endopeptidase MepM/ murein hydrolase activator NlpD
LAALFYLRNQLQLFLSYPFFSMRYHVFMKRWLSVILHLLCATVLIAATPAAAPPPAPQPVTGAGEDFVPPRDEISPAQEQAMWEEIKRNIATLRSMGALAAPDAAQAVTYNFPLRMAPGLPDYAGFRVSAFADHNPASGPVLDYNGGARTYDGHHGTDYALYPFGWNKVDAGDVQVIAAAAGTIAAYANVDPTDHNCGSSSSDPWNYVALVHADGRMTIYGHMRYNSLTGKGVGQTVAQGEYLGTAASSGNSSGPHLHFEARFGSFSSAEWIDPYAGPNSQPASLWASQRPYLDSAINRLATHSSPPSTPDPCQPSLTNLQDSFTTPGNIYFYAYYRDYQGALATQLKIYRPDGSLYSSWQYAPAGNPFSSAWSQGWVTAFSDSDPAGTWRFEAAYNGQVYETFFDLLSDAPLVARDDFAMTPINTPVTMDVLGNDGYSQADPITITALGLPMSGTVSLVSPRLVYTPTLDFLGQDVFTYTVSTSAEHADATVTVLVVTEVFRVFLPLIRR